MKEGENLRSDICTDQSCEKGELRAEREEMGKCMRREEMSARAPAAQGFCGDKGLRGTSGEGQWIWDKRAKNEPGEIRFLGGIVRPIPRAVEAF